MVLVIELHMWSRWLWNCLTKFRIFLPNKFKDSRETYYHIKKVCYRYTFVCISIFKKYIYIYFFRNNSLSTVKNLYESKDYLSVVNILKETLKPHFTFMDIPSYQTMTRMNQYIFILNSFLELKNYYVRIFNFVLIFYFIVFIFKGIV